MENNIFPELPLNDWKETKETVHRYFQIIGKLRMSLMPKFNHWWHITLYVNSYGITTSTIPYRDFTFEIQFNFIDHELQIHKSTDKSRSFKLMDGLSVAEFHEKVGAIIKEFDIPFEILAKPYDLSDSIPFSECYSHNSYDASAVEKAWLILKQVDMVFKQFGGRSYSKTCPVHIYWHHLDLVVTRFSGKRGPELDTDSIVEKEAYSHEVISFGFWFGDDTIQEPAFYSYTYPSPAHLANEPLSPAAATWQDSNGSPMAILLYNDIRTANNPKKEILDFLESSYQAGAKLSGWDVANLRVPE